MRAALLSGPGDLKLIERDPAELNRGELRVQVEACTVCGTDRRAVASGHPRIEYPRVLGHEFVGVVTETRTGLFSAGDRVSVQPAVPDGTCAACEKKRPGLWEHPKLFGYHYDGAFADQVVVPALPVLQDCVIRVPGDVPPEAACLAEPLGCVIHAVDMLPDAHFSAGEPAVVFGAGPMGCLAAEVLRERGSDPVVLVDPDPERRVRAERFADRVVETADLERSPAIAVLACPSGEALESAVGLLPRGGALVLFAGIHTDEVTVSAKRIHYGDLTVVGGTGGSPGEMARALKWIADNKIRASEYIDRTVPLADIVDLLSSPAPASELKQVVVP